jgi:hypothetical protein
MADEKLEFALFEHAVGYALFRVHQWEEIGLGVQSVSRQQLFDTFACAIDSGV